MDSKDFRLTGHDSAAQERQRGFRQGSRSSAGAGAATAKPHAPTGLSPTGDWGWTARISSGNPYLCGNSFLRMEIQMETERLVIRRLTMQDTEALLAIMGKPEVMYAWEHGFTHADVVQWIERQLATATGIWAMQAKPPVNACAMHQWIWDLIKYIAA